jgi:AcrR family transcriptional regulator
MPGAEPTTAPPEGLRERKKRQTREAIAETARRLFVERGFEAVRIAEIAEAADVSEKTVFNYFPTKEDLVYWRLEEFEEGLLASVRDREPGESALAGFGRFMREPRGLLAERETSEDLVAITRMIASSPALLAREQQVFTRYTGSLASLLASETGADADDVEAWVAAHALMGVHRSLVAYARTRVLAGARNPRLRRDVRAQADRALAALERGLGDYAVRPRT